MDEKSLKTSLTQRIVIAVVAVILLGSTVAAYAFIALNNSGSTNSVSSTEELLEQLSDAYDAKNAEITAAAEPLSDKYFPEFSKYLSQVKAYNETTANNAILDQKDLKVGTGKTLEEGDTDYMAYYIGWCADGEIFDSSFNNRNSEDDDTEATALVSPLDPSNGLIEGWEQGVIGMKIGGVRQITMSGDLAYGDTQEICGGLNKPLRFIVMAIDYDETIGTLTEELTQIYFQIYSAIYGSTY